MGPFPQPFGLWGEGRRMLWRLGATFSSPQSPKETAGERITRPNRGGRVPSSLPSLGVCEPPLIEGYPRPSEQVGEDGIPRIRFPGGGLPPDAGCTPRKHAPARAAPTRPSPPEPPARDRDMRSRGRSGGLDRWRRDKASTSPHRGSARSTDRPGSDARDSNPHSRKDTLSHMACARYCLRIHLNYTLSLPMRTEARGSQDNASSHRIVGNIQ